MVPLLAPHRCHTKTYAKNEHIASVVQHVQHRQYKYQLEANDSIFPVMLILDHFPDRCNVSSTSSFLPIAASYSFHGGLSYLFSDLRYLPSPLCLQVGTHLCRTV